MGEAVKYYGQPVEVVYEGTLAPVLVPTDKGVVEVQPELVIKLGPCFISTRKHDRGFTAKAMPQVTPPGVKLPAMPDFSLEARQKWVEQQYRAKCRRWAKAKLDNAGHEGASLEVEYPWGKRRAR